MVEEQNSQNSAEHYTDGSEDTGKITEGFKLWFAVEWERATKLIKRKAQWMLKGTRNARKLMLKPSTEKDRINKKEE